MLTATVGRIQVSRYHILFATLQLVENGVAKPLPWNVVKGRAVKAFGTSSSELVVNPEGREFLYTIREARLTHHRLENHFKLTPSETHETTIKFRGDVMLKGPVKVEVIAKNSELEVAVRRKTTLRVIRRVEDEPTETSKSKNET